MRVLIIGGGIGGLCLAQGLRQNGIQVRLFEKQANPAEDLAGYGIHIDANGRKALRNCLAPAEWQQFRNVSSPAGQGIVFRDTHLNVLAQRDDVLLTGKRQDEVERAGIGRTELRSLLLSGLNDGVSPVVQWGKRFERYESISSGGVRAYFTDGTSEDGDVLVGADGGHSKVREQYLPAIKRVELGILAIAGRYILDEARLKDLPEFLTDGSLNNVIPRGKGWLFTSAWGSHASKNMKQDEKKPEHFALWAYVVPRQNTPPNPRQLSAEALQDIALAGMRDWSPHLTKVVREGDKSTIAPIELRSAPHLDPWQATNVTLLGDAIHSMTPMAGIGANTALRDSELLTDFLVDAAANRISIVDAIGKYEERMREYANAAVSFSRRNAESASSGGLLQREAFRLILQLAQVSPIVMRNTIGREVIKAR
ncbi:hypothetical protein MMC10_000741 [Thelotrema lepadinum]|nr:hypothetical protein [Thelotrema lepadinum]